MTDNHDQTYTGARTPGTRPRMSPRLTWGIAAVLGVFALAALVMIVFELASLRPRYQEAQAEQQARADATRVAEQFAAQVNNYDVKTIDDYQAGITPLLTTKFKGEFEKAMTDIVTSVQEAKMESEGKVLASGVASVDADSAEVLVVSDATVKTVFDTRARHFRWEVSLVKVDGDWLVDNFTPVA